MKALDLFARLAEALFQGGPAAKGSRSRTGTHAHPVLGQSDPSSGQSPAGGTYSTFSNPFVYFQSIASSTLCLSNDVGLSRLSSDLRSPAKTPSFVYIAPDRCHDANPTPCRPGAAAGVLPAQ